MTLKAFLADPENPSSALNAIPKAVLLNAKGLAIFTVRSFHPLLQKWGVILLFELCEG